MDALLLLGAGLLFVGIVVLVFGVAGYIDEHRIVSRRLAIAEAPSAPQRQIGVLLEDNVLKRFERLVTPGTEAEREKVRQRLIKAGYRKPSAMRIYYASKGVLAIVLGTFAAIIVPLLSSRMPVLVHAAAIIGAALFGLVIPSIWIERQMQRRQQEAEQNFPDALDMLLVCIEAGLGIDQACKRVGEQIGKTSRVLAEELRMINEELLAGKARANVFHDFAERLGVNDIRAFATVLKQSDEFGVSIAETLRIYASEMRHKRVMRAEEKANLMPVKVAMGSIFFTVPPTILIVAGPSLFMLLRAFASVSGH